jgi:hypothetical protein
VEREVLDFRRGGSVMKQNPAPLPEDEHPFDAVIREAQEFAKKIDEERERLSKLPLSEDPLFKDVDVYTGPVPPDISVRHDHYLHGEDD